MAAQQLDEITETSPERENLLSVDETSEPDQGHSGTNSLQWRTAVVVMTSAAILLILYGLWLTRTAILIVFAGMLVAVAIDSLCVLLERRTGVRRRWSLPLVLLAFACLLWLGLWLRGPAIENQIDRLHAALPVAANELTSQIRAQPWAKWLVTHGFGLDQPPAIVDIFPKLTRAVSGTLGFLGALLIIVFLGVVIAAEPQTYYQGFKQLFPLAAHDYVNYVTDKLASVLRLWLLARLACMCIVGILVFIGLWALGVPLAGTLGILAGLLTFIPNVGPVLSAIPPILLAFTSSPSRAVLVILLFWAVHALEGFLITPIANRAAVDLPPGLTLSAQLLLGFVAGGMGVALAAPLTVVAVVLVTTVYREKILSE